MKSINRFISGFLAIGLFWGTLVSPVSADPNIANLRVQADEHLVFLNAVLTDGFTERMQEAIESGLPMTLNYEIELLRKVPFFKDKVISENRILNTVHYDTLKKVYRFSSEGKNVHSKSVAQTIEEVQKFMLTLDRVPIAPLYKLDPSEKYYVRVKAELEADGFWFPLNYILFFVPFNEFETDWAESSLLVFNQEMNFPMEAAGKERGSDSEGNSNVLRSFSK